MTTGAPTVQPQNMRELRLLAGLDFTRLAELAGVSGPTVARIERGECRRLRCVTVEKIALALRNALQAREVPVALSVPEIELMLIRARK